MSQDADRVFESAMKAIENLAPDWSPDGICTFVELAVELTSRLGKAFGVPHADILSVTAVRDKSKTRALLQGVKSRRIHSEEQLVDALKHIGYPGVIKPVSGAASLCVQRFDTLNEAISLFHKTRKDFTSSLVVSSGALGRRSQTVCSDEDPHTSLSAHSVITTDIMIEEYLDGPEVDVDIILSDGECQYAYVIDNGPTFEPYFAETWAAVPSLMEPPSRVSQLEALAIATLKQLGFTDGIFHVELKYTRHGPRLIEVNARMGGGPTRKIHRLVSGVDLVVEQLMIAVGIPSRPPLPPSPLIRVGYAFINARKTGYVESVDFFDKYKSRPFIVYVIPYIEPFEVCYGPQDGLPSWLGEIVVAHPDGPTALRIVQEIEQEIADEFSSLCVPL
jgi:biotin carboxylase